MELNKIPIKLQNQLKKFYPALIILLIGILLLSIPGKQKKEPRTEQTAPEEKEVSIEEKLAIILEKIDGAGDVRVMLSTAVGQEFIYQTDENSSDREDTRSLQCSTVTVTDADRNQNGLIRKIIPEKYQGAIIVCKGADSAGVRLAVVEAVSKITGLGADHISVLKMK